MPNPRRLLALLGGPAKVSRALGIHESAVSRWPERGVPDRHAPEILDMAQRMADTASRTRTMIEARDGKLYGAQAFWRAVRNALGAKVCRTCKQVVR